MSEIIYGRQPVLEMLIAGKRKVFNVMIRNGVKPSREISEIIRLAETKCGNIEQVDHNKLGKLTDNGNHQGVAARVSEKVYLKYNELAAKIENVQEPLILILDHIQDTGNLGALFRVADAAGVDAVIIPADRAAHVTPAVVRASAGATEHVDVCVVTNLVRTMKDLQKVGLWISGLEACDEAQNYTDVDLTGAVALVVGSEGHGLGRLVKENCDFLIKFPLYGKVTSLNAASAGAVALYEVRRQRTAALQRNAEL